MISRYQRVLFIVLLVSTVVLAVVLYNHHLHNYTLRDDAQSETPIESPAYAAAENATLALADDRDGSITATQREVALPPQPAVRVRALLEHLLAEYSRPKSPHAIGGGIAVEDVYLVDLPLAPPPLKNADGSIAGNARIEKTAIADPLTTATGKLAVINLRSSWCDAHPSGISTETLTIDSILGTLHANMPEITKVRFLADGQPRSTLAGNVLLDRTYDAVDTANVVQPAPAQE